jgi:hypothetical protein
VCKAVVNCLTEIHESGKLRDRTIVPELWNFKGKRKATISESVEYICSQVKRLNDTKNRRTRRYGGISFNTSQILLPLKYCLL